MEGILDLSWWQAKNSLDSTVEKVSISKMLLLDKSYSREEQAYVKKTGVCKVVQEESTSQPHHCKFTISFAIHSEMLSGQRIYNLSRLNLRSGYPGSTLMCNSVLSEYPCLKKKGRFPKLVWALAQNLAIPAERLVSQTWSPFPSFTNQASKRYSFSYKILTSLLLICQTFISKRWEAELERSPGSSVRSDSAMQHSSPLSAHIFWGLIQEHSTDREHGCLWSTEGM